jgi:outer membrane protein assembly factor BamB
MCHRGIVLLVVWGLFAGQAWAADWLHWRGPEQNGVSRDTGLPSTWSPEGENLLWKQPYGGRSAPVVSRGRVYIINNADPGKVTEQERVLCFDARSGQKLWEYRFNLFLTDIVTNRVGWANLAADPETGNIYAHGVQGLLLCFSPDGQVLWQKSLTEEYGRITGYGGRIGSPVVDEDLVIINMLNASWGDQARGGHRFLACDKRTGEVVWWSEPGGAPLDTLYATPVVAVINGQRLLIVGTADGGVYALKARTGEKVWGTVFSKRGLNASPVVEGHYVYACHSEENLDTTEMGGVYCFDASQIENGSPKLVWRRVGIRAGYASPAIHEGRLYVADNSARLHCLDARTGETLWDFKYGTEAKASPVWADGKIYIGEVASRFHILEAGPTACRRLSVVEFPAGAAGENFEINGSVAVSDGRVYIVTGTDLYCIGTKAGRAGSPSPLPAEPPASPDAAVAHIQVVPADVVLKAGESVSFRLRAFDAQGRFLREVKADAWSLPQPSPPPTPPGGTAPPTPPPLRGTISPEGRLTVDPQVPSQQGVVLARFGTLTSQARVRVAADLPIVQDFEKLPVGSVPGGWINAAGKFVVVEQDGSRCLKKLANNSNPLLARAYAYLSGPNLSDYTIEADLMGTERRRFLPDMGVVNCRYSLTLDGSKQRLLLRTWEARKAPGEEIPGRINAKVDFAWKPNVWYHFKLKVSLRDGRAICQGKVWVKGEPEPDAWTIEAEDPIPNREGAPAIYAYAYGIPPSAEVAARNPGTEVFFDNIRVTANRSP